MISNAPGGIGDNILGPFKAQLPHNVHVVATAYDKGNPATTVDVTEQMLIAHPDINVIYSWEGTAVAGIATAIKERNAVHKVVAVVNDLTPQVVDGIRAGIIYGTNWQHFCAMSKLAVDNLVAVSQGKAVPATTDSGTTFVTAANLDRVLKMAQSGS